MFHFRNVILILNLKSFVNTRPDVYETTLLLVLYMYGLRVVSNKICILTERLRLLLSLQSINLVN